MFLLCNALSPSSSPSRQRKCGNVCKPAERLEVSSIETGLKNFAFSSWISGIQQKL